MLIATRDLDGAWKIADSRTPFAPSGITDISPEPSPTIYPKRSPFNDKGFRASSARKGFEFDMIPSPSFLPPPSYGYNVGYADRIKSVDS